MMTIIPELIVFLAIPTWIVFVMCGYWHERP